MDHSKTEHPNTEHENVRYSNGFGFRAFGIRAPTVLPMQYFWCKESVTSVGIYIKFCEPFYAVLHVKLCRKVSNLCPQRFLKPWTWLKAAEKVKNVIFLKFEKSTCCWGGIEGCCGLGLLSSAALFCTMLWMCSFKSFWIGAVLATVWRHI